MDSRIDTYQHKALVQRYLTAFATGLLMRGLRHDDSKLEPPEKQAYDQIVPRLSGNAYGSEEYKANLREMKPAIDHHYAANRHHPEHFANGVNDMTLMDVVEMVCDWKAASERGGTSVDSDRYLGAKLEESMRINQKRFALSDQMTAVIRNTLEALAALEP